MKTIAAFILYFLVFPLIAQEVVIEKREMSLKHFPCMKCHENASAKTLNFPLRTPHERMEFSHMDTIKNCFSCHDQKDRNALVLHTGERVSFDESYRICIQCHGEKQRDWNKGIHGKQIGSWNGKKYRSSCASCHDPHSPKFPSMATEPGPVHPNGQQVHSEGH